MPDNVIDSLSIKIGASVNQAVGAIDSLQERLVKLNGALENFRDGGTYLNAITNLSQGFQALTSSLAGFDPDRVAEISKSLGALSKSAIGLQDAFGGTGSSKGQSNAISQAAAKLRLYGEELAHQNFIEKKDNVNAISEAFIKFARDLSLFGENAEKTNRSFEKLSDTLLQCRNNELFDNDLLDMPGYEVREYLSNSGKVLINNDQDKVYDYARIRSTLGRGFSSQLSSDYQDIENYTLEMNDALGTQFQDIEGIYNYVKDLPGRCKEINEAYNQWTHDSEFVKQSIDEIVPSMQSLADIAERTFGEMSSTAESSGENGITNVANALRGLTDLQLPDFAQLKDLASAVKSLGSESATKGASVIQPIAEGLKVFDGNITIPDFTKLQPLASAMQSLGAASAVTGTSNLKPIMDALQSLNGGITIPDFSNLKVLGQSVQSLGSNNAQNASWVLPNIMAELESFSQHFSGLSIDTGALETIKQLGSAFSKLGGKNATGAISTLPQLSVAIRQMVDDLNNLPEVNQKTQELIVSLGNLSKAKVNAGNATKGFTSLTNIASKAIDMLSKKLQQLLKSVNTFKTGINLAKSGLTSLGSSIVGTVKNAVTTDNVFTKLKNTVGGLGVAFIKLRGIIWGFRMVSNMFNALTENASSLTEVQNVVRHVYDPSYLEEFNKASEDTINTIGMSKLSFQQYASRYQAMGKALGITNNQMAEAEDHLKTMGIEYGNTTGKMGDMSVNLTRLAGDMASFYDVDVASVQQSLQAVYTGQTRPLMLAA